MTIGIPYANYQQRGFSLIELLVTLVIFSIGLLSIAGLQTVSKQANYEALQRTTASQIAYGLLEDMRMNGDAIDIYAAAGELGEGSISAEPAPNCTLASPCNSAQKAAHDLDIKRLVPGPNIALAVVLEVQNGAVARLGGNVIGRRGIVELGPTHVRCESVHDFQRAGVVDTEVSGGIGQGKFLV